MICWDMEVPGEPSAKPSQTNSSPLKIGLNAPEIVVSQPPFSGTEDANWILRLNWCRISSIDIMTSSIAGRLEPQMVLFGGTRYLKSLAHRINVWDIYLHLVEFFW